MTQSVREQLIQSVAQILAPVVELQGAQYVLLRERDIHAVAAPRVEDGNTGLYL